MLYLQFVAYKYCPQTPLMLLAFSAFAEFNSWLKTYLPNLCDPAIVPHQDVHAAKQVLVFSHLVMCTVDPRTEAHNAARHDLPPCLAGPPSM